MSSGLPKVQINVNKSGLGKSPQTEDGIVGKILSGVTVTGAGNVTLNTPVALFSISDAENMGITETGTNAFAWKQIKLFYDIAGNGAQLWIMLVATSVLYKDYADKDKQYAPAILDAAKGKIRTLGVSKKSATGDIVEFGIDKQISSLALNAQALAVQYAEKYKPLKVVIDGKDFNGTVTDLKDYTQTEYNRVAILLANNDGAKNASIGLVLGKLAYNPVQRSIGRVLDGALPILEAHLTSTAKVETFENSWDAIHNKGYIFLRSFVGRSGYFFTDDPTLTLVTDDLNSLKRVAVMDKVTLLAYYVFVGKILNEIPLEGNGKIAPAFIKSWQADVENAINTQMVANGELSAIKANIDPNQDILLNDTLQIKLSALPVGYAKYIEIDLGFVTSLNN